MNAQSASNTLRFTLKGISAAPGLVQGPVINYRQKNLRVPRQHGSNPGRERTRLQEAIHSSQGELAKLRDQLASDHPSEAIVFDAHILMLEDASLLSRVDESLAAGLNAEAAWMDGIVFFAGQLESISGCHPASTRR